MKFLYTIIPTILLTSCALNNNLLKEGMTISQVNSEAWIFCIKTKRTDEKYINFKEPHPFIENIEIYKTITFEESLSQQEKDIFIKEGCNESLFFIDGKSISIAKVKELESAIPMEVRDAGIVKRKAKRDAELEGLRRAALIEKARIDAETPSELRQKLSVLRHKYTGVRLIDDKRGGWIFPPELVGVRNEDKNEEIRIEQKLERLEKEERDIKLQQDENIRKVEREKEDVANKTVAKEAQRLREQCLSNGVIGICQSSSQNNTQYVCGSNLLTAFENIFNKYCYVTDNYSIHRLGHNSKKWQLGQNVGFN